MTALRALACGLLGLVVGSFLNVVVHRVPEKQSVLRPRSRCPRCRAPVTPRDNVPVASWLLLRGRCRSCNGAISFRYVVIEVATAALFASAAIRLGEDDPAVLPAFLVVFAALVAIFAVDFERGIVPNLIVYPAAFLAVPLLVVAAAAEGDWGSLRDAILGAGVGWGTMHCIWWIQPGGMGYGDVRLAGLIGLITGWLSIGHVLLALFMGFLIGSFWGMGLMLAKRREGMKSKFQFGPALTLGAVAAVLFGSPILSWYTG